MKGHVFGLGLMAVCVLAEPVLAGNWPSWRGPGHNGVATGDLPPLDLEGKMLWKAELPGRGCSTPIVWENRVYVTAPIGEEDGLLAFDETGKEVWRKTFGALTPGRGQRVGSSANSSPLTDGEIIVAYYKSGTVVCLDLKGEEKWKINLQEKYGKDTLWWDQGTSPIFAGGNIVIAVLQTGGESYLVSLDKETGKEVWRTTRKYDVAEESGDAYTTPHVVKVDGVEMIITWGGDHLTAHEAAGGKLVWECGGFNPERAGMQRVIASAVVNEEFAVVPFNRGDSLAAIRLDGKGDVTKSHWMWRDDKLGSDAVTPVLHEGKVYVLKDGGPQRGRLTCVDAKTGEKHWETTLPKGPQVYYSSPVLAGDRFYSVREDGMLMSGRVTDSGLEDVKSQALEEGVIASPVVAHGKLYVRSDSHLFCFGEK